MWALKVDNLYFLSYSKESLVVLSAIFDPELWSCIRKEIELLSDDKLPKKLSSSLPDVKKRINEYRQSKVILVAEVKSKSAVPCEHKTDICKNHRVYHDISTRNTVVTGAAISDLVKVYLRCIKLIESSHKLCVKKASEVLVFLLGELDRLYKPEIPHAYPVAFAFRGYSMKTEAMRKMIQDVLFTLFTNGLYTPVVSYDGQWAKLAFQKENSTQLTILDLQRQLYNAIKTKSVSELTKIIFETGVIKADSFENLVQDIEVHIEEGTNAMYLGVTSETRLFRTSNVIEKLIKDQKSKAKTQRSTTSLQKSPACVSNDIDSVLSNVPQEIFANLDEDVVLVIQDVNVDDVSDISPNRALETDFGSGLNSLFPSGEHASESDLHESDSQRPNTDNHVTEVTETMMESEIPSVAESVTIDEAGNATLFSNNDAKTMLLALKNNDKTCKKWGCMIQEEFEIMMTKYE